MPLPVHWFDGILNAGSYHTDSTNTWKNLGSIISKIFRSSIYTRALDNAEIMKNYAIDC